MILFQYLDYCKARDYETVIEAPYQKVYDYYRDSRAALLQTYIYIQLSHMLKSVRDKG